MDLKFVSLEEIKRIKLGLIGRELERASILADIFRVNILYMITKAGSGHIGTSFSSIDVMTWLWTKEMANPNDDGGTYSDTFFSSKGHDAPALYAILTGLGKIDFELIHKFRRLDGLPGHPDISTPYVGANTGSLGMGISKARGMAMANRLSGRRGDIYVLLGDGELQEGQIWESLQPTANGHFGEVIAIVDCNKIQSDARVVDTSRLGGIKSKFEAFGWRVTECYGHDFYVLKKAFEYLESCNGYPKAVIANTVKGKGVSFMEKLADDGYYKYHSGAPSEVDYVCAMEEIVGRINDKLSSFSLSPLRLEVSTVGKKTTPKSQERLVPAYGDELVKIAEEREDIIAMDADLVLDTGLIPFKNKFPERYVECGIAEQDMVSMAGGLALRGKLPIVHSFECFLTTRANEQIYNNATEGKKIIYVGSLAGILPAGPGHSHQSLRGISLLGSIPDMVMIQPADEEETRAAIRWAVNEAEGSVYIRLTSIPFEPSWEKRYDRFIIGRGACLKEGKDSAIITYGPVLLGEAYRACFSLEEQGTSIALINLPWLNRLNKRWIYELAQAYPVIFTVDDHYVHGGQGNLIAGAIARHASPSKRPKIISLGIGGLPACGGNDEVLKFHKLDAESIASKIREELKG